MVEKEFNLRHNCCKEKDFEWISIDPLGNSADRLICKVCKREFIDTIFIKRLNGKCHLVRGQEGLVVDWEDIEELAGDKNEKK